MLFGLLVHLSGSSFSLVGRYDRPYLHFSSFFWVVPKKREERERQDAPIHGQVVPRPHAPDGPVEVSSGH